MVEKIVRICIHVMCDKQVQTEDKDECRITCMREKRSEIPNYSNKPRTLCLCIIALHRSTAQIQFLLCPG